jgi:hypothetical protein
MFLVHIKVNTDHIWIWLYGTLQAAKPRFALPGRCPWLLQFQTYGLMKKLCPALRVVAIADPLADEKPSFLSAGLLQFQPYGLMKKLSLSGYS